MEELNAEKVFDIVKVEELPPEKKIDVVRTVVSKLTRLENASHIVIAELLSEIKKEKYWEVWGYDSFNEYIELELGFTGVKGRYLVRVYEKFHKELGMSKEDLRNYEWSKLTIIARIANQLNYKELLDKCTKMSVRELNEYVKDIRDSEKIEDEEEVFKDIKFRVSEEQLETINHALEQAHNITGSEKGGNLLELICAEFLSNRISEETANELLMRISKAIENNLGLKLALVNEKGEVFVIGEENE